VLAGGGAAGNAWELGVIAGLCESGVDLLEVDLIVGTSAGSTVAAQITSGTTPTDLYAAVLAEAPRARPSGDRPAEGRGRGAAGRDYVEWSDGVIAARMDLASQVEDLRTTGSRVETVFPDAGAGDVFDANALDPSTRLPAARGGHEQGRALAGHLTSFWN
jgi:predicted acylesterase/phospholipase RssA